MAAPAVQVMVQVEDPSQRCILSGEAPLVRNLAALWALDPAFAEALEGVEVPSTHRVEAAKNGELTASIETGDGRVVHLHSRHRPGDEGKRLAESVDAENAVFCVHGLGLGYHLEALFDSASDEAIFVVLEPDLGVVRMAMEHRDLSRILESRRVIFVHSADKVQLFASLTPHTALMSVGMALVTHPPSMQLQREFHLRMQEWISEFASYGRTNLNTLVLNGRRTCENLARNLGWYVSTPGVGRLKDRYRGKPAIIVSAGPSLRKNQHLLESAAGRAVMIAVQTTLQPLIDMGIEPHFVTSLDHHDISTRFFERLPAPHFTQQIVRHVVAQQ